MALCSDLVVKMGDSLFAAAVVIPLAITMGVGLDDGGAGNAGVLHEQ